MIYKKVQWDMRYKGRRGQGRPAGLSSASTRLVERASAMYQSAVGLRRNGVPSVGS